MTPKVGLKDTLRKIYRNKRKHLKEDIRRKTSEGRHLKEDI